MESPSLPWDRIGVAAASAFGLSMSCYFALEAEGVVSNFLGSRSLLLASIFSEKETRHVLLNSNSWLSVPAFALALWTSITTARRCVRAPKVLPIAYGVSTLVLPVVIMFLTLAAQPIFFDGFCVPCLLIALPALAIFEFRRSGSTAAGRYDADPSRVPALVRLGGSSAGGLRRERLGRDDATAE
jgi:hypothetical protein